MKNKTTMRRLLLLLFLLLPSISNGEKERYLYEGCKLYPFEIAKKWANDPELKMVDLLKLSKEELNNVIKNYQCKADNLKFHKKIIEDKLNENNRN